MTYIIKILFSIYLLHGKLIRFFQRRKRMYEIHRKFLKLDIVDLPSLLDKWGWILSVLTWRADPLWQLKDAVTDPWSSLIKGKDDCDGFASVSSVVFGKSFKHKKKTYLRGGLVFALYKNNEGKIKGHCISFWRSIVHGDYICISSSSFNEYETYDQMLEASFGDKIYGLVYCGVVEGDVFDLYIKRVTFLNFIHNK